VTQSGACGVLNYHEVIFFEFIFNFCTLPPKCSGVRGKEKSLQDNTRVFVGRVFTIIRHMLMKEKKRNNKTMTLACSWARCSQLSTTRSRPAFPTCTVTASTFRPLGPFFSFSFFVLVSFLFRSFSFSLLSCFFRVFFFFLSFSFLFPFFFLSFSFLFRTRVLYSKRTHSIVREHIL